METWNLKYILFCSFAVKLLLSQSQQRKSRLQDGLTVYWDYRCRKTLWKLWYLFLKCHLKTTERGTAKELEWEQFTFSIAGAEGGPTSPPGLGGTGQGGQALALWCLQQFSPTVHSGAFPSLTGLFWAIFTTQRRSPFCFWNGMEFNIGWNAAGGPWLTSNQQNKDTINKSSTEKYKSEHFTTGPVLKTNLCGNNKELTEICLFSIYLLPKND